MATVAQPLGQPLDAHPSPRFAERLAHIPYHWQVLVVISLSAFMVILDTTIVNVALPRIIQVFQSNVSTGQLVLAGYMLALAVVVPASGYLSDRFGAKRTYLMTIVLFTLGSALCGLAPSMEGLIVFRVIQGLGGGMLMPLGMSMLFQVAPPEPARHDDGHLRAAAADRADGRADAGRLPGRVRRLAPDLHPERAGRHRWRCSPAMFILRETPTPRGHALRLGRLHPLGDLVLDGDAGDGAGPARRLGRPERHDPAADRGARRSPAGSWSSCRRSSRCST